MALIPGNPVVGGTVLRRAAIISPNFDEADPLASPTPSWGILQDGNAYFFGVTVTGNMVLTGTAGVFEYSGTPAAGNPPVFYIVPPGTGTDPFGNSLANSGGGATSMTAAQFTQLVSGGIAMGLLGATPTIIDGGLSVETDGAGQSVSLASGTVGSNTGSDLFVGDSASDHPGAFLINGLDGTTCSLGETIQENASSVPVPAGSSDVTILSRNVAKNLQYYFRGIFRLKQGATNVDQSVGFSGPGTSACVWYYSDGGQGATSTSQKVTVGSLTTVSIGFVAASDEQYVEFEGTVTFSGAGTFAMIAAEGADAYTVQPGCIFLVRQL